MYFHHFLNKSMTISAEGGTNDIFIPVSISTRYDWNSAPIDGTNILRSIPVIGRELHFPIDINLNALPKLTQNNAQDSLEYLKLTKSSRHFSKSILKHFIENCRTAHTERIKDLRHLVVLEPGDIVMARTAVQSDKSQNTVTKLCYAVRGPYHIIRNTGHGSYYVKTPNKPDSPKLNDIVYIFFGLLIFVNLSIPLTFDISTKLIIHWLIL